MAEGIHLTSIGEGSLLAEPTEGFDPSDPDRHLPELFQSLHHRRARLLFFDLSQTPLIDSVYYRWLEDLAATCRLAGAELTAVNMQPTAAFALARHLEAAPSFTCQREVGLGPKPSGA